MKRRYSFPIATNSCTRILQTLNRLASGSGCAFVLILLMTGGCKNGAPSTLARRVTSLAGGEIASLDAQQQSAGSLADRLKAVQSGEADKPAKRPLPNWKPFRPGTAAPTIPLGKGLVVVEAISDYHGDYEFIGTILDVSSTTVRLAYSAELPLKKVPTLLGTTQEGNANPSNAQSQRVSGIRVIDKVDLEKAHGYAGVFVASSDSTVVEHFPGTTALGVSTEMLNQLRGGKDVEFHFEADPYSPFLQLGAQVLGEKIEGPTSTPYAGLPMYMCTLQRVEPTDLAFPVLVNDQRVELPAVHSRCSMKGDAESHIYFLDQPSNPIGLFGPNGQVIKITLPPPEEQETLSADEGGSGPKMERALAAKKPVEVYGIYFDFNSATIRPESEVVLQQIADILRKNPDWKLDVGGHTDNIGGDAFNLGLSERRAAAVKDALVTRYKIASVRLATQGYGASRPIESNQTLEGRARNRRVELQRQ